MLLEILILRRRRRGHHLAYIGAYKGESMYAFMCLFVSLTLKRNV